MEGLRSMIMDMTGMDGGMGNGMGGRPSGRRAAEASPLRTANGSNRPRDKRPSHATRPPRTTEDVSEAPPVDPPRRNTPTQDLTYLVTSSAAVSRSRKEMDRRSAISDASALFPAMHPSHEMSMLLHERPLQNYAPSSVASDASRPGSPVRHGSMKRSVVPPQGSPTAPSFSYDNGDDKSSSSGGSLKLRIEDELHLADLVSMGPVSEDESESVF